jgi:hypothetical protein
MMFYTKRTVGEQALRLPSDSRGHYIATQLDRIKIDGEEILGYFEYSFLEEKSYKTQPERADDGSIPDLENYATFLTPRLIIRYNMMQIEDYRKLMKKLKAKNVFTVECYDIVEDKRVVHEMYFAPPQMPIIYQQYLNALGVQEYTIELIGTNRKTHLSVTYDYNFDSLPDGASISAYFMATYPDEPMIRTVENIPYNKKYLVGNLMLDGDIPLANAFPFSLTLRGWSVLPYEEYDTTLRYTDGVSYFLSKDMVLYAQWGW